MSSLLWFFKIIIIIEIVIPLQSNIIIIIFNFCLIATFYFIRKGIKNYGGMGKSRTRCVSAGYTSHYHIYVAEWICEADIIKTLNIIFF